MKIAVRGATGIIPKTAPELTPPNAATIARDCFLLNGNIGPIYNASSYGTTGISNPDTIFRFVDAPGTTPEFMAFVQDANVAIIPFGTTFHYAITGLGIVPQTTTYSLATTGTGNYPITTRPLGLPMPTTAPVVAPPGGGTPVVRSYAYTWITDWNEESMPSVASTAATGDANGSWTVAMSAAPTSFNGLTLGPIRRKLYRTEGTSAQFQLVAIEPAVGAWTNNQYVDSILDTALPGDALVSADWAAPPSTMQGGVLHPSGMLLGFDGQTLYVSEAFQPHAYPAQYQLYTEYPIVGIAVAGTSVVVCTTAYPYLLIGTTPGQMYLQRSAEPLPCLSKRGIVCMGSAVVFPSTYGLVSVDINSGTSIITETIFDYREWQARQPSTMFGSYAMGRIHMYSPGLASDQWLIIDARENIATTFDQTATAFHTDTITGEHLFASGTTVKLFDDTTQTPLTYTWQSKMFVMPHPLNFGAARINFDPAVTNPSVTFTVYSDNDITTTGMVQRFTKVITSRTPFRLPAGFKSYRWQFSVVGTDLVKSIELAETVQNLDAISQFDMMNTAQ